MKMGVSLAGVSYGWRKTVGLRSVRRASRLTIHVRLLAWETRRVMRMMFFILGWWWVIEGREWEGFGGYLIEISFQLPLKREYM
jgi:hypothetical protein